MTSAIDMHNTYTIRTVGGGGGGGGDGVGKPPSQVSRRQEWSRELVDMA
jgi:hypothetical protein